LIDPQDMARIHAAAFTNMRPWSAQEFTDLLASPLCFAIGDPRAFALVRVIADEAELLTIATHPDHRRRGLAAQLMDQWHAMAVTRGAAQVFLEVAADNSAAIALYLTKGYVRTGLRKSYYARQNAPDADAIIMSLSLIPD
jgi:ribosomal-protein-alanine N-acetyltransferase